MTTTNESTRALAEALGLHAFDDCGEREPPETHVCVMAATLLRQLVQENEELRRDLSGAVKSVGEWATKAGQAQGALEASEMAGVVAGWKERALAAEQRVEVLVEALGVAKAELQEQANGGGSVQSARNALSTIGDGK